MENKSKPKLTWLTFGRTSAFDKMPGAPLIFQRLMLINYAAVVATMAYGIYSGQYALLFVGAVGFFTLIILDRLGAA